MIKCIIVDLDGTLVDTSAVAELRAQKRWREVESNIQRCTPYHEAVDLLNTARAASIKVALFTNSPLNYVRNILKHFQLAVDYIVAYHDVRNRKPASDGVEKIRQHFGVSCEETIYIGDSEQDRECALNAQVKFFATGWGEAPDIGTHRSSAAEILECIETSIGHNQPKQFRTNLIQNGHRLHLGYYLGDIKQEVWAFKNHEKKAVERWINKALEVCDSLPPIDFVVRAFGHAELDTSANTTPLDLLGARLAASIGADYRPDCLHKSRPFVKSTMCSAKERAQQAHGAYIATPSIAVSQEDSGPTFLVVDDVLTSGATTGDIVRALSEAYPRARVFIFTLVKTLYRAECEHNSTEAQHNAQLFQNLYSSTQRLPEAASVRTDAPRHSGRARLVSKKFSANYANTNHNFVFHNLRSYSIASEPESKPILDVVYVLRNMLQRGKPTIASRRLRSAFGLKYCQSGLEFASQALISPKPLDWRRLIRGDSRTGNYPAKRFFDELMRKYFGEYQFVKQLTLPEVNIFEMTQVYVDQFQNRQVDFFIPQAGLIFEIDGKQHEASVDDKGRDEFTQTLGLKTIRFTTEEIATESQSFIGKMSSAVDHMRMIDRLEQEGILSPPNGLTLRDYRLAYNEGVDIGSPSIRLTAAIRFQLLVLELIECGEIRLGEAKKLAFLNRDGIDFAHQGIGDLAELLSQLLTLRGLPKLELKVDLEEIENSVSFPSDDALLIDFSILERFDDSFQVNPNVIYARTHYLDFYRCFANSNALSMENCALVDYDFFEMSCSEPICYQLDLSPGSSQREALKFFLGNLFLPLLDDVNFREGQLGIIGSALSRKGTIGLLPTGAGKSICYQLSAVLQPAISFVVCPIKSLMYDQKADLDTIGFMRSNFITSDLKPDQKIRIQNDFGRGKYFLVFISPERFQTQSFRSEMTAIGLDRAFAYAVIDEAHCLSEWGHDFRTSYLNLANTIERLAPDASYIGLTATASVNVLKDIQSEFNIPDENVRTPLDYTREELSFHVIDDRGHKTDALIQLVDEMEAKWNGSASAEQGSKAGIIFTSTVNGQKGCYKLAGKLSSTLGMDVRFFSGSAPSSGSMGGDAFDAYKREVQNDFKASKYRLLTATKAFGMGVNKGNIAYTVHYGIPGSMEALYQEAGRAGRNKRLFTDAPADCYVLLTKERNIGLLDKVWDAATSVAELKESVKGLSRESDVNTNLYLMTQNLDTINDEFKLLTAIYQYFLQNSDVQTISASASQFGTDKFKFEKAVYRLFQLGIVLDWLVEDFFKGRLTIEFSCPDEEQLQKNLEIKLRKYDTSFKLSDIFQSSNQYHRILCERLDKGTIDKNQFIFLVLLLWSYDHFAYNRRQSLKTVYEQCSDLAAGKISEEDFKNRLEGYFKFNESSHLMAHLAENPDDTSVWLSIFFEEDSASDSKEIISTAKLSTLKEQLSRFLESYKDNICLNYLSGILRLTTDEFDDADGERRMASSLERLKQQCSEQVEALIRDTLKLKPLFSVDAQCRFARLINEKFPESPFLEIINAEFEDPYSYHQLLTPLLTRLAKLTTIYKGIEW